MAVLDPAVAAIRRAVAQLSRQLVDGQGQSAGAGGVLVACSGGADSLALAAATSFVGPRLGLRMGLVTVDHQLQPGSAERAQSVAEWARAQGFDPVLVETVGVAGRAGGPEAAARDARYEALVGAARATEFPEVLLGHTRDDQAETVLLAILRGSGPRGLAAMPARREVDGVGLSRPLLAISREQTRAACVALGFTPWEDPHNSMARYARVRARGVLTVIVDSLGPAVVPNLARTATLAAADADLLDALACDAAVAAATDEGGLRVADLATLPSALRTRVLHGWALGLGAPGTALSHRHILALDALIVDWHGQGRVYLPGGIVVTRRSGVLTVG